MINYSSVLEDMEIDQIFQDHRFVCHFLILLQFFDQFLFLLLAAINVVLFHWTGDRWELLGIKSDATKNSARNGYNGLFVRVGAYNQWIESIINPVSSTTSTPFNPFGPYQCDRGTRCGCGYSDVTFLPTRILDGEDVIDGSWSMIVSLRFYGTTEHFCAGTLLSDSFVLTAAHCVDDFSFATTINITVYAGTTSQSDSSGSERGVAELHIHPNYTNRPLFLNNIALLQLDRPLRTTNNPVLAKTCVTRINSSTLPNEQYPKNGTPLVVIGWGAMRPGSLQTTDYLKQKQIYAIDKHDPICQNVSRAELQFCAGLQNTMEGK